MWLSRNILSKMVNQDGLSPEEIAHRITMSTAEIENFEFMNPFLESVISAKILDVLPHPNAGKLTLCDLDTGRGKLRVVCGAPNHRKGDVVALAPAGTRFGADMVVKKAKIRGEESAGMLCSERELGLSDDHSGVMILPADTTPGVTLASFLPDWVDVRFEIDNKSITHRPDLWSHAGFAREISALFGRKFTDPVGPSHARAFRNEEPFEVTIKDPAVAPRYCGLAMKNIRIAESPQWLKANVTAVGMRPINNIVDITNYVMAELGEPMHAFDRAKLRGNEILVRAAQDGEYFVTLDGQGHTLCSEDVVIADSSGAIALAGVMGGGDSEIDGSTTDIILEAANFNPVNIRRTAGRYNLRTEAAIRFEKSLDPELCTAALIRCYDLIKLIIPGSEASSVIIDAYPVKAKRVSVSTTGSFIRRKLGQDIGDEEIGRILGSLDFKVTSGGEDMKIDVPSYRATKDISIPDDIVEEVGRIYGFDNITPRPPLVSCASPRRNEKRLFERRVKEVLTYNHNLTEVSSYSFVGEDILDRLGIDEDRELRLRNPLSKEHDRLRRSLIPNLVKSVSLNQRHCEAFGIYELGRVYLKEERDSPGLAAENTRVSGALYDRMTEKPLFYAAKGVVTDLLGQLLVQDAQCMPLQGAPAPYVHPARSMEIFIGSKPAGMVFELHPRAREAFDIKGSVALFDLDADLSFTSPKLEPVFRDLQKFPDAPFEISILADKYAHAGDVLRIIRESGGEYIREAEVISVYEGPPIPDGKKSVSFKIVFAAAERTLGPEEIEKLQAGVIAGLSSGGYSLR